MTTGTFLRSLSRIGPVSIEQAPFAMDIIEMFLNEYASGTNLIILSDPHPDCGEVEEYSLFIRVLIRELCKQAQLKKLFLEAANVEHDCGKGSPFSHLIPGTKEAYANGIEVYGFDNRTNDRDLCKEDTAVEQDFYTRITSQLGRNDERALVIVGSVHATKNPALSKLGRLLSEKKDLKVKTYLTAIGWQHSFIEEATIIHELNNSGVNFLAVPDISLTDIGSLKVLKWKTQMSIRDSIPSRRDISKGDWIDITCSDYDGLLFFRSGEAIKECLCKFS